MTKKSARPKRTYSLVLEEQVHERLAAAADADRRTISGYLNYILDRNLPKLPAQSKQAYQHEEDSEPLV